jgi:hypothetical protein
MTARRTPQPLPLEQRRAIWARIWRETLLRPRPELEEPTPQDNPQDDSDQAA